MDDQKVSFTYPDGFIQAANSLEFLPDEESRKQFLGILVTSLLIM